MIMKRLFFFAAIILAVAACSKAEPEAIPADNDGNGIPFRATITADVATKALAEGTNSITATWAEGEEVALIYNDWTPKKDIMTVESVTGGVAVISGTITGNPSDNADITLIYPASAADGATGKVLGSVLYNQEGTLSYISAHCDIRKGTGKLTVTDGTASLSGNISLANYCSIFKFTVEDTNGSTINPRSIVISFDRVDYTIVNDDIYCSVVYAALPAVTGKAISFTVKSFWNDYYYCSKPAVTFEAGKFFQTTLKVDDQLALPGAFSVSSTKMVAFSKGNLQWFYGGNTHKTALEGDPETNTGVLNSSHYIGGVFVFADHQWDICGANNAGSDRKESNIVEKIGSFTSSKRIDLFMYATSGFKVSNNNCYYHFKPFAVCGGSAGCWAGSNYQYGPSGSDIAGTNSDWGVFNAILNGGDEVGIWHTLTQPEWDYLINTRANATSKRGFATVNGVRGLIILPDVWNGPSITSVSNIVKTGEFDKPSTVNWTANDYTAAQWETMEANGAVFLPAAGTENPSSNAVAFHNESDSNAMVSYWTSSRSGEATKETHAYAFDVGKEGGSTNWRFDNSSRSFGRAVRLVMDVTLPK